MVIGACRSLGLRRHAPAATEGAIERHEVRRPGEADLGWSRTIDEAALAEMPATLVVPADAIVDSGLPKTVFVECGNGHFEPRLVETGSRIGDDVEVTKGLTAGERIVISGTFFVDSESRMKAKP
jgi:Cu(I)/Ag(I) efflux system membrane fusion protein